MTPDLAPVGHLRVGHWERDAVATLLQSAAADGRLSLDELDDRLGLALSAVTYGDLEPLVADLSIELPWHPSAASLATPVQGPRPPGYIREDPLRLDGGMSRDRRQGTWTVPPFIRINQGLGAVKLDCLQATPAELLIEIEVVPGAGSVVLVLPNDWGVDADRLSKGWGSKVVKIPRRPVTGRPLVVFYGGVGLGTFRVRAGRRRELRRIGAVGPQPPTP